MNSTSKYAEWDDYQLFKEVDRRFNTNLADESSVSLAALTLELIRGKTEYRILITRDGFRVAQGLSIEYDGLSSRDVTPIQATSHNIERAICECLLMSDDEGK